MFRASTGGEHKDAGSPGQAIFLELPVFRVWGGGDERGKLKCSVDWRERAISLVARSHAPVWEPIADAG